MEDARDVMDPLKTPLMKKLATSYNDNPSKPGITIFCAVRATFKKYLFLKMLMIIGSCQFTFVMLVL
jgi:hypothetical protein